MYRAAAAEAPPETAPYDMGKNRSSGDAADLLDLAEAFRRPRLQKALNDQHDAGGQSACDDAEQCNPAHLAGLLIVLGRLVAEFAESHELA